MRFHPLLQSFKIPKDEVLGPYRLGVLGPDDVHEDYEAVIESTDRLKGFMGGTWPEGLTLEDNRTDLCWHLREFDTQRSFAWIVRDSDGSYLGCAYVFPDFAADSATVSVWMRSSCDPDRHEEAFSALLMTWLEGPAWPAFTYRLISPGRNG
ncbi:MAG: hypothetical protein AAF479_02145 [Pseudomonadota bacterium]